MKLDSSPIEGVADVEVLRGVAADPDASPDLLVEVPHGADRRAHYDALRARLAGPLPEDLHVFFHANTDLGAWHYGRRVAERVVEADPTKVALVIRCLLPRTFVDTNRVIEAVDELATGGMTAAISSESASSARQTSSRVRRSIGSRRISSGSRSSAADCSSARKSRFSVFWQNQRAGSRYQRNTSRSSAG